MKLFLGYIFAFIFVFNTSVSDYLGNSRSHHIEDNLQYEFSLDSSNLTVSPYQNYVHHILGVDFQEKNEKFKKFYLASFNVLDNLYSYSPQVNKFDSSYFSRLIVPKVSRHILLERFII